MRFAPLFHRRLILAEHPFSGTGRIHQDTVKKSRKKLCHALRRLTAHNTVADPHSFNIPGQNLCSVRYHFIGHQQSFSPHPPGDLCTLATRRRTQIQYAFPRLRIQNLHHCHSRRLLNIIRPCLVQHILPRLFLCPIIETFLRPAYRFQNKRHLLSKRLP